MHETRYHRPATLAEASALFAEADDGRYLAGGQTLIPVMKQRLAAPSDVIDIARLEELQGVSRGNGTVVIGAGATHAEVHISAEVRQSIPALAALAGGIGDPAVRQMGTLGGSLANNDPAADYPAALLALGATIHTDRREIAAEEFFTGLFETTLDDGEVVVQVAFPVPARAAYRKFPNPASRYAMAGVFLARFGETKVRTGVTGAGNEGAYRAAAIEQALSAKFDPAALEAVEIDPAGMLADIHGSADYRANLVRVMAKRAVAAIG